MIEQLQRSLPPGWKTTLLAVDGAVVAADLRQLARMPADATHLFISAGGNNALGESSILTEVACTVGEALFLLHEIQARFQNEYHSLLHKVLALGKPTVVCTVYDAIPDLGPAEKIALGFFNEIILRSAFLGRLPVIDLRLVCSGAWTTRPFRPLSRQSWGVPRSPGSSPM